MKRMLCWITLISLLIILLSGCQAAVPAPSQPTEPVVINTTEETIAPSEETIAPSEETTEATEAGFDPYSIINTMTTEELVGQMFLARCPSDATAISHIQDYHLGGYILFGRDFEGQTPDTIRATLAAYQAGSKLPMLIAVDEEGGLVTRVSSNAAFRSEPFPSPRQLFDEGGMALVAETEEEKCQLLRTLGINVNLAPVCDVTTDPQAFMYSRSLGQSADVIGQYVDEVVTIMADHNIGGVLKHFPGYGNNTDTHVGIATDDRSLASLEAVDLVPFYAGIQAGCDAIMVSHTIVNCLDDQLPASVSPAVIGYLRQDMGFDGVIVTDDLVMQAITDQYGTGEAAVLAVLAGNDLLCSSEYPAQYEAVLDAVKTGRIGLDQIETSVARILLWKYELGLLKNFY